MQRTAINKTLGAVMIAWGIIVSCIGAAQNWSTVMALRALQGVAECSISPAFLILTATWWKVSKEGLVHLAE